MRGEARRVRHTREKAIISFDFPKNQKRHAENEAGRKPGLRFVAVMPNPAKAEKNQEKGKEK